MKITESTSAPVEWTCKHCTAAIAPRRYVPKGGVFCGKQCRKNSRKATCLECGKGYERQAKNQVHCSRQCNAASRKVVLAVNCEWCGKEYNRRPSAKKNASMKYCSHHCHVSNQRLVAWVREKQRARKAARRKSQSAENAITTQAKWERCLDRKLARTACGGQIIASEAAWEHKLTSAVRRDEQRAASKADKKDGLTGRRKDGAFSRHNRVKVIDWKYGGTWNRLFFDLMNERSKWQVTLPEIKWQEVLQSRMANHRQRLRRKRVARQARRCTND